MNEITTANTTAKLRFSLTRKNQKGQVAIFVALIFQVIFVFFALLINVGLLVHHKINLQQSTDLAAYYGAMKQAESLNAIAHINFQIKQAWKLLTWRYRIVGTFGFQKGDTSPYQHYPFESATYLTPARFIYNGSSGATDALHPGGMGCNDLTFNGIPLGIQDIPFFCIGHSGFKQWSQSESLCRLSCAGFENARTIPSIPLASSITVPGGNVAGAINAAVTSVNDNMSQLCGLLGPTGATVLTRFFTGYIRETTPRLRTIEALAANLSLDADKVLDIEGNLIQKGSEATLKNNLTEANLTGYQASSFRAENGLANNNCKFQNGLGNRQEFLKKIEIEFLNYFIHTCTWASGSSYIPATVFLETGGLHSAFNSLSQAEKDIIESLSVPGQHHTVGYEKNPHCVEYYAVKASSEPQIPFLPLTKIKLNAVAVAKPFGGTIGPWYGKSWPKGSPLSEFVDTDQNTKVDENLPIKKMSAVGGPTPRPISQSIFTQPNFSLFVGDKKGLRDADYVAAYHSMLAIRDTNGSTNKNTHPILKNQESGNWPDFANWAGLGVTMPDYRDYDSLAVRGDVSDPGMRGLEISAIAPNQFDITHYSIDPDFYNNYYRKLYNSGLAKILDATGRAGSMQVDQLRADFGAVSMRADQNNQPPPLTERSFSVKDQILLKNTVLNITPSVTNGPGVPNKTYTKVLDYLVSLQSSLLTGWTFLSFSDYITFPARPVDQLANTMSFGQCLDPWNNSAANDRTSSENFKTPMDQNSDLPPVPGNCITGGRTGYSVKLVSPSIVRDSNALENPLDDSFFNF